MPWLGILVLLAAAAHADPVRLGGEFAFWPGVPESRSAAGATAAPLDLAVCDVPGVCWEVASIRKVAVNLELNGKSKRCAKQCRNPFNQLYAIGDFTYEIDGGLAIGCPPTFAAIGSGTVRHKGRRAYLVPPDPDGVERALASCFDVRPRYSAWVRIARTETALRGKIAARGSETTVTPIGEGRIRVAFKNSLIGVPWGSPIPPKVKDKLPLCPEVLSVNCQLVVEQ